MPIQPQILEQIAATVGEKLSFSACYIRFKGTTFVLVTVYLYHAEKLSERNTNILFQLNLLRKFLGLPLIIFGDFNMLPEELQESGWPD